MALIDRIQKELVGAMKAKESLRLSVLRGMKAALTNKQIEKMRPLTEAEEIQVLQTLVKQRKESIEQFTKGGRNDLAGQEQSELELIETYLPAPITRDEIEKAVAEAIQETEATGPKDMGKIMKVVMNRFAGCVVDGKLVNEIVRGRLAS